MSVAAHTLPSIAPRHRDDDWLRREVDDIWARYFGDTPRVNEIEVGWRRPWKRRLGVISLSHDQKTTRIGLNSLLARHDAPYCLTLITVAHELTHYAHGFGSPLPRKYSHPHRGGIVTRELRKRGLEAALDEYHGWIDQHWWSFYARHGGWRRR
ncbi:MAG TPA: hypothetical protein VFC93_17415 [Chloroflexota bacterium]|nr:hypothetical protein [Chloroflexota bacterium]